MENTPPTGSIPETSQVSEVSTNKRFTRGTVFGWLIDIAETLILALVMFVIINALTSRVRVENISMQPTLQPGQLLLVSKISYKLGEPKHGDVVIFHAPNNPSEDYIKRIIGVPGDLVTVESGQVSVNGVVLNEPYIAASPGYNGSWTVPEDSLFVLGDNRNSSSDSHAWGFVPMDEVIGKALFVYWPFDKIQNLTQKDIVAASQ
ncbi:MAG: signal peptidase I [Anaerolineaceae bacterium]|nr:signal peptidase I [Anaerolineaceae bacterium]